jgi:hypothetical protein
VHFTYSATDADGDSLRYYLYVNGTYNSSTTSTSLEVTGFDLDSYEYVFFAWDGYTNSTNSTTRYFNIRPPVSFNVTMISPSNNTYNVSREINFAYRAKSNREFNNCSLWANESYWQKLQDNTTGITNNTVNQLTHTFSADGDYIWNVECYSEETRNISLVNWTVRIDSTGPQFSTHERTPISPNEDIQMQFNITLSDTNSINSVWFQWNGTTNFTAEIRNTSNEFYINLSVGNTTAHDINYYEWNANDSLGNINSTGNYSFTTANQAPAQPAVTAPADHLTTNNNTIHFVYSTTDADAEDSLIYYLYINGTYNTSTTSTSSLEILGVADGNYEYVFFAWDGYVNGTNSTTRYFNINTTGPTIISTNVTPYAVINGSNVSLGISVANAQSIWASILKPDLDVENITLTNNNVINFTNVTQTGYFNVTFYANDSLGTLNSTTDYFESFGSIVFNVTVITFNSTGINSTWSIFYRNIKQWNSTIVSGNHTYSLANVTMDLEFKTYGEGFKVLLKDVNLSVENNETFGMDRNTGSVGYLLTYGINSTYNISNATVTLSYNNLSYTDEDTLYLYKCDNYEFASQACGGAWVNVTNQSIQNKTLNYFEINVTTFSGFSIKQYTVPDGGDDGDGDDGDGGGGAGSREPSFVADAEELHVVIKTGESSKKTINITNDGKRNLNMEIVVGDSVSDYVLPKKTSFLLRPDEVEALDLVIIAPDNIGIHIGKITIIANGTDLVEEIPVILEVGSGDFLFDVNVQIPDEYKSILPGGDLLAEFVIFNLGEILGRVDVSIIYSIQNLDGEEILREEESAAIETKLAFIKKFTIPEIVATGQHVLAVEVLYAGTITTGSATFDVIGGVIEPDDFNFLLLMIIIIIATVILIKIEYKTIKESLGKSIKIIKKNIDKTKAQYKKIRRKRKRARRKKRGGGHRSRRSGRKRRTRSLDYIRDIKGKGFVDEKFLIKMEQKIKKADSEKPKLQKDLYYIKGKSLEDEKK